MKTAKRWENGARPEENFSICAPKSDMVYDESRHKLVDGWKLIEIPDPIVLYPLVGGFWVIVSKWGLESNDIEVQNSIEN